MSDNSDRPGSYAKVNGSRRKRKGKRGKSLLPPAGSSVPPASVEQPIEAELVGTLDAEGEEVERHEMGRPTMPDWGTPGTSARDDLVDDLRRKPSSSHAPRKQVGPLGMDDARSAPSSQPSGARHERSSTPRPSSPQRFNVVEIDATSQASDNSNHEQGYRAERTQHEAPAGRRYEEEPANGPFGDPFADEGVSDSDEEPFARAPYGPQHEQFTATRSARAGYGGARLSADASRDEEGVGREGRPSMSSVFGARPSLRPSPPPSSSAGLSALWWVVVAALSAIIVAAGVIALREAQKPPTSAVVQGQPTVAPTTPTQPVAGPAGQAVTTTSQTSTDPRATTTTSPATVPPVLAARPAPVPAAGLLARPGMARPADAGVARTFARPAFRPRPAAPVPAAPAPSAPEHIPQNPYN